MNDSPRNVRALALLLRQLADGLHAGVALAELIPMIERSSSAAKRCQSVLAELARAGRGEIAVHEALAVVPALASTAGLVRAAESREQLPEAFSLIADDWEDRQTWQRNLAASLAWPVVLTIALAVLCFVCLAFVVPAYAAVFESFGGDLPGPTAFVMWLGAWASALWLPAVLVVIVAYALLRRRWARIVRSPGFSHLLRMVPMVWGVFEARFNARVARLVLATMEGGLPLQVTAEHLRDSTVLHALAARAGAFARALQDGTRPDEAVGRCVPGLGDLAVSMVIAVRSPRPGEILVRRVADLEHDLLLRRGRLERTAILGTYLIVGAMVAFLLISMYLPIFRLGAVV